MGFKIKKFKPRKDRDTPGKKKGTPFDWMGTASKVMRRLNNPHFFNHLKSKDAHPKNEKDQESQKIPTTAT